MPIKVGIVVDWPRCQRFNGWKALLKEINTQFQNEAIEYELAELILYDPKSNLPAPIPIQDLQSLDVLIINWDVVNGDPDFGSHLILRWIEHRRPEIFLWLRGAGKRLIIEGQTVLSVPCQEAYDALVGSGELPVCGREDPEDPMAQSRRVGYRCRRTKHAPQKGRFQSISELSSMRDSSYDELFPERAGRVLSPDLRNIGDWRIMIYRGWFRRTLPGSRSLQWVSIFETADRPRFRNHSTMQVARVGSGAIFATTMFLAHTGQAQLILAMFTCDINDLPKPTKLSPFVEKGWKSIISLLATAIAVYLTPLVDPLVHQIAAKLVPSLPSLSAENLKDAIKLCIVALGGLLFHPVRLGFNMATKQVKEYMGF